MLAEFMIYPDCSLGYGLTFHSLLACGQSVADFPLITAVKYIFAPTSSVLKRILLKERGAIRVSAESACRASQSLVAH